MKPLIIVGAEGFVGRSLRAALDMRGDAAIAIGHQGATTVTPSGRSPLFDALVSSIPHARALVYLASASVPISSAHGTPRSEVVDNLLPTTDMLDALETAGPIPLIYASSAGAVYATDRGRSSKECDVVAPRSYHGAGKIAAEHFVEIWARLHDTRATLLRPSNLYGPRQISKGNFAIVPAIFSAARNGEPLPIRGDGSAVRDFLFIDDFVDLVLRVLDSTPRQVGTTLNASSGTGTSLMELIAAVERVIGKQVPRVFVPTSPVDMPFIVADPTAANAGYGWKARTGLQEGLSRTWHWYNASRD